MKFKTITLNNTFICFFLILGNFAVLETLGVLKNNLIKTNDVN